MPHFQARSHIVFHIKIRQILLTSAASFLFEILTSLAICSHVGDRDIKENARRSVWKKCQSQSDKQHSALYIFTVTGTSNIMQTSGFIVCTLYAKAHSAFFSLSFKFHEQIVVTL